MFAAANILAHEVVVEVGVFVNEGFDQRSLAGHQSGDARAVTGQDAVGMHHNANGQAPVIKLRPKRVSASVMATISPKRRFWRPYSSVIFLSWRVMS